ncbi:MAG: hypothetical protein IKH35_05135 [Prevotella sp.]|nr:hypothetical protein [Prevotella sp.]
MQVAEEAVARKVLLCVVTLWVAIDVHARDDVAVAVEVAVEIELVVDADGLPVVCAEVDVCYQFHGAPTVEARRAAGNLLVVVHGIGVVGQLLGGGDIDGGAVVALGYGCGLGLGAAPVDVVFTYPGVPVAAGRLRPRPLRGGEECEGSDESADVVYHNN